MRGLPYYLELEYTYSQSESCALLTCTGVVFHLYPLFSITLTQLKS